MSNHLDFKIKKNHIELINDIDEEIKKIYEDIKINKKNKFLKMIEFHKNINEIIKNKYNNKKDI